MTERQRTVSDHLLEAKNLLEKPVVSDADRAAALQAVERAIGGIQLARCEATTALDQL